MAVQAGPLRFLVDHAFDRFDRVGRRVLEGTGNNALPY